MDLRPPLFIKVAGCMGFDWSFNKRIQKFKIRPALSKTKSFSLSKKKNITLSFLNPPSVREKV